MKRLLASLLLVACPCLADEQFKPTITRDGAVVDLTGREFNALEDARWIDTAPASWPTQSEFADIKECVNGERYPLSIQGTASGVLVRGGSVRGRLHPLAPWHVWKMHGDGDGVRVELPGPYTVEGVRIDNVEDGLSPRGAGTFTFRGFCATRIHDDMIENDEVRSGLIEDFYAEGHSFYSARGDRRPESRVVVRDGVIDLLLQPHQGGSDGPDDINERGGYPYPDGLGCGGFLKMEWRRNISGTLHIQDTVIRIPRHSTSSNQAMMLSWDVNGVPQVTYTNCAIVWLGEGDYPHPIPTGVTLTRDNQVFERAKAAWFKRHPEFGGSAPPVDDAELSKLRAEVARLAAELQAVQAKVAKAVEALTK